ncbi:MAG TPA: hypothetical protein VFO01_04935 [Trebonia sp.]|nr:hypothetical protein [Trebonia sp.]
MLPLPHNQVAVAAGTALLLAATLRALAVRWRARRALAAGLRRDDPATRAAAVRAAARDGGVRRHARLLLAMTTTEPDPRVRAILAETVSEHRWEPAASTTMAALRLWAGTQHPAPEETGASVAAPHGPAAPGDRRGDQHLDREHKEARS